MGNLISFFKKVADGLRAEGNFGTAHVYRSTLNIVTTFHGSKYLDFHQVNSEWLKDFEVYLRSRGSSWNTVSTYLRVLRAVYNRAVDLRKAEYIPHLFRSVYTIPSDLRRTKELFILMFLLRGLPFVDLAYLRKSDLRGNVITYRRRKTGRSLSVTLTPESMLLLEKHISRDLSSPYLFPILHSIEGSQEAYREYQLALRSFNQHLELLGQWLGLESKLSSYTARHTWATTAYYCEIHPGIISEAMGHSSITVTETYLKPFRNRKIDEANNRIVDFVKRSAGGIIV